MGKRLYRLWKRGRKKMPLTKKGRKIMKSMKDKYGKEKGEKVFHASRNKGTIEGVDKVKTKTKTKKMMGGGKVKKPVKKMMCGGKAHKGKKGYKK